MVCEETKAEQHHSTTIDQHYHNQGQLEVSIGLTVFKPEDYRYNVSCVFVTLEW